MTVNERERLLLKKQQLENAYYSGIKQITFEGETITYQSLSDMRQVISDIELKLNETHKKRLVRMFPARS